MLVESQTAIDPDILEPFLLSQAQRQCPIIHHFSPGLYIREVSIPAGTYALGHRQKFDVLNDVLKGKVALIDADGVKVIEAPARFTAKPGRKLGYIIEDTVWQNIYPNPDNCRDIETLEDRWLEKSPVAIEFMGYYNDALSKRREHDRIDFYKTLEMIGVSPDQVQQESEIQSDIVEMPIQYLARLSIRKSPISGKGLFLSSNADAGEYIAPARIGQNRTIAGRFVNHAKVPNCEYREMDNGDIGLYSISSIFGCVSGHPGDELTVNYMDSARISGRIGIKS